METILDKIKFHAEKQPDSVCFTRILNAGMEEDNLTFEQLYHLSCRIATGLDQIKIQSPILFLFPQGFDFIVASLGSMLSGNTFVPCALPKRLPHLKRLEAIAQNADCQYVLTTETEYKRLHNRFPQLKSLNLQWLIFETLIHSPLALVSTSKTRASDVAFIQYTSGSTGNPKGVMITYENLNSNLTAICKIFNNNTESVSVTWLPHFHDMGMLDGVLQPIFTGFRCIILSPAQFVQNPALWFEAISKYKATYSGGPNFCFDYAIRKIPQDQITSFNLSTLKTLYNGSEPVKTSTLKRFAQYFADAGFKPSQFMACYGLAEATLAISATTLGTEPLQISINPDAYKNNIFLPDPNGMELCSSGRIIDNTHVKIINPDTMQPCAANEIGEIWVSGPGVSKGYWNNPIANAISFNNDETYLKTGDLGLIFKDELFITGRLKDLIILNGKNHYPHDIEATILEANPELLPGSCAVFSVLENQTEKVIVLIETSAHFFDNNTPYSEFTSRILKHVFIEHEISLHDIILVPRGHIFKTSSGKIQRNKNKEYYGNLMHKPDIIYQLKQKQTS